LIKILEKKKGGETRDTPRKKGGNPNSQWTKIKKGTTVVRGKKERAR